MHLLAKQLSLHSFTHLLNSSMDWCLILCAQCHMPRYKHWLSMFWYLQLWSASVSPSWWQFTFSPDDNHIFKTTPGRISLSLLCTVWKTGCMHFTHPSYSLPYIYLSIFFVRSFLNKDIVTYHYRCIDTPWC